MLDSIRRQLAPNSCSPRTIAATGDATYFAGMKTLSWRHRGCAAIRSDNSTATAETIPHDNDGKPRKDDQRHDALLLYNENTNEDDDSLSMLSTMAVVTDQSSEFKQKYFSIGCHSHRQHQVNHKQKADKKHDEVCHRRRRCNNSDEVNQSIKYAAMPTASCDLHHLLQMS